MKLKGKKIMFMTRRFGGGGAERMTVLLANYFPSHGFNTSIVAIDGEDAAYKIGEGVTKSGEEYELGNDEEASHRSWMCEGEFS